MYRINIHISIGCNEQGSQLISVDPRLEVNLLIKSELPAQINKNLQTHLMIHSNTPIFMAILIDKIFYSSPINSIYI